jgi:hypothetical protein
MSDLALKSVGFACAAGSVWFAVHMFTHQDGGPRVNAIQDFAIFAQPNRMQAVEAAVRVAGQNGETRKAAHAFTIDMTPVGALPNARQAQKSTPEQTDVRIVEMNADDAVLETPKGFRRVRVGDESPEVGKIISIRKLADYWVVVASERSLAQPAPPTEQTAEPGPAR